MLFRSDDAYRSTPCTSCSAGKYTTGSDGAHPVQLYRLSAISYTTNPTDGDNLNKERTLGATSCSDCAAGKADLNGNANDDCVVCEQGKYAMAGSTACTKCPKGKADKDVEPHTPCVDCDSGKYADDTAFGVDETVSGCIMCATGKADQDVGGANPATPCTECDPGTYSPQGAYGDSEVTNAAASTSAFPLMVAPLVGEPIAEVYGASSDISLGCQTCLAGYTDDDSASANSPGTPCVICTAGKYAAAKKDTGGCTDCVPGQITELPTAGVNVLNIQGPFSFTVFGATQCSDCAAGQSDQDTDAATECSDSAVSMMLWIPPMLFFSTTPNIVEKVSIWKEVRERFSRCSTIGRDVQSAQRFLSLWLLAVTRPTSELTS